MTTPLGGFSGLVSGLDWRTMVDQIIQVESRPLIATKAQVTAANSKTSAWTTFSGLASGLKTAVVGLRDGTALSKVSASVTDPSVASGGAQHVAATAADGTSPGRFLVEVISLAQAEKAGGEGFASTTAALGLTGEFFVNGSRISVAATDSLAELRSKINAANSGTTATKVTATILTTSATSNRLVLGSEVAGAAGLSLKDGGTTGVLRSLGLLDSFPAVIKRPTSSGAAGDRFSSTSSTVKTLLGSTEALGDAVVTIGGHAVTLNLASESLTQIAAKMVAAGVSATVASEVKDGTTTYYLDVSGTTSFVDSGRALELLGLVEGGRSSVAQQIRGDVLTVGATLVPASGSTALTALGNGGYASGAVSGDTLTIAGTRGDGSAVTLSFTVTESNTVADLLAELNNTTDGFGKTGTQAATGTIDATGRIRLTDSVAGDSRLALSIVTHNEGGGRLDVGTFTADVTGRDRAIVTGSDAVVRVDGVTMTRDTNTVTDAVTGVTLTLLKAEAGVIATVDVTRGPKDATAALNGLVTAYNAIVDFVAKQTVVDVKDSKTAVAKPPLYGDSTLTAARASLSQTLLSAVSGAAGDLATASAAGLSLAKDGKLSLDATKFEAAFTASYNDVQKLFAALTSATDPEVRVGGISNLTQVGTYDVVVSSPGTTGSVAGTGFGGTYADDATADTLTVTDTVSGFVANVSLANGMSTAAMVGALNSAFAATAKNKVVGATTVYGAGVPVGTVPMTTTSKWSELTASGGASLGVASGDSIGYAGVRVNGTTYAGTFSIADASGTVGEFIAQLQQDIGTGATVSLESGRIAVESKTTGTSQLALTITPNNQGGGSLGFGAVATSVVGKGLMEITASAALDLNNLVLSHRVFGSTSGFQVAFSGGGANGTDQLGLTAGSYAGTDVAGTIGGYAATGVGQTMSGATGTPVAGLTLKYVGTAARSAGQVSVSAGLGEIIGRVTDGWLDTTSGMLLMKSSTISAQVTRLNSQSARQQARLDRHRASLVKQFTKMETSIAKMQSQSATLTKTLSSLRTA